VILQSFLVINDDEDEDEEQDEDEDGICIYINILSFI
jgi:hypothetical protein